MKQFNHIRFCIALMTVLVVFTVLFCSSGGALADQWSKTYGGKEVDKASSIQQTSEGGYIVAGNTSSFGAGKQDIWALRLNVSGDVEWQKTYGGAENDGGSSIQRTTEGGYVVAGYTSSSGAGKKDVWLLKLDRDGNIEWQKTYGGTEDDEASSVQQTTDGGYVVAGYTSSSGAGKKDVWLLKLDRDGNIEWQRAYGGTEDDETSCVQQTLESGYVVAATTSSFGAGRRDGWILKLDKDGNFEWQKTYGMAGDEEVSSVQQTSDEGYIVTGWTSSSAPLKFEAWILKLDSVGNIQWQRTYGGGNNEKIYSNELTTDGKYIVVGSTNSFGAGEKDAWILELDGNGNILSQKTWGDTGEDEIFFAQQTLDGGFVVAGWSDSFGAGNGDMWLSKYDSNGDVQNCQFLGTSSATPRNTIVSGVGSSGSIKDTSISPAASNGTSSNTEVTPSALCMVQGPDIFIDPTKIDFGPVTMGNPSSPQSITIENVGSQYLLLDNLDITGTHHLDFGIREDNCSGQTLGPSDNCAIEVIFSPTSKGKRSATLSIPSNDSDFSNASVLLYGEGVPPITLSTPANHASFSVCSLYELPVFSWDIAGSFRSYEIQFSKYQNFPGSSIPVKVRTTADEVVIKSNPWKQVLLIPGEQGGPVYWRVFGTYTGGRSAFVSEERSITIEPAQPIKDAEISPATIDSTPALSWENNCNVKFKVLFGNDDQFSKKYSITYTIKNPTESRGKFNQTLTPSQWNSIKKLVGGESGAIIHWKVESKDGANRGTQTTPKSFVLED